MTFSALEPENVAACCTLVSPAAQSCLSPAAVLGTMRCPLGDHLDLLIPALVFFPQEAVELLLKACVCINPIREESQTFGLSVHSWFSNQVKTSWSSKNDTNVRDLVKEHFLGSPKPVTAKPLPSTAGEGWLLLWALLFLSSLGTSG